MCVQVLQGYYHWARSAFREGGDEGGYKRLQAFVSLFLGDHWLICVGSLARCEKEYLTTSQPLLGGGSI